MTDFDRHLRDMTNADIAKAIEYIGSQMRGGISDAVLREAAKRLRNEPEPYLVSPPPRDMPPLKAYAHAD